MKTKSVAVIVLLLIGASMTVAQDLKIETNKDPKLPEFPDLVIQGAEYDKRLVWPARPQRTELFAHAGQSSLVCPETIVVGVITPPAGWTDYSRRVVPFENLTIVITAQGSKISCDYDQGRYAVDRLVPGRVCTREGATSPHISCRAIPTKK
jgi:hypothetical protein